jgi:hypothetical protein
MGPIGDMPMKIAFLGSTVYKDQMEAKKIELIQAGHEVKIPAFNRFKGWDELQVCLYNRANIEWADEIYIWWDNRSPGFIFDFGMLFYAKKKIHIVYLEPKTFAGLLEKYERMYETIIK